MQSKKQIQKIFQTGANLWIGLCFHCQVNGDKMLYWLFNFFIINKESKYVFLTRTFTCPFVQRDFTCLRQEHILLSRSSYMYMFSHFLFAVTFLFSFFRLFQKPFLLNGGATHCHQWPFWKWQEHLTD